MKRVLLTMGIKNLNNLLKAFEGFQRIVTIEDLRGKRIAIDSSILIYKWCFVGMKKEPSKTRMDTHMEGFFQLIIHFLRYDILPVFVFDGKPPDEKKETIEKRSTTKQRALKHIDEINEKLEKTTSISEHTDLQEQKTRLEKQATAVTGRHKAEIKYLVKLLGLPYYYASGEAEALCVQLQKAGMVDYTLTDDTDVLAYGCPYVLKKDKNNDSQFILIDTYKLYDCMKLTHEQFIEMCLLCGCDYIDSIHRIGTKGAYNKIRKYSSIKNLFDNEYIEKAQPLSKYNEIFKLYYCLPVIEKTSIELKEPDYEKFKKFLMEEKEMTLEAVNEYYNEFVDLKLKRLL